MSLCESSIIHYGFRSYDIGAKVCCKQGYIATCVSGLCDQVIIIFPMVGANDTQYR